MICSKSSLVSLLLVLNQASGFAPGSAKRLTGTSCAAATRSGVFRTSRIPTAIHYANDPDSVSISRKRKQQRRNKRRYELLSNNISQLTASSSTDDVVKAIKRACNLKSIHDIEVIGSFLLEGVDDSFGYGYKGSLLARFAVAALRLNEYDLARRAMQMRRERFAESMTSFESAAVLRGLLRAHKIDEAFELLEEELSVVPGDADRLKHRSQALASIVSRHFFHNEPQVAIRACRMLAELGPVVVEAGLTAEELDMPWYRVLLAADQCKINDPRHEYDDAVVGAMREYPLDDAFHLVFKRLSEK